MATATDTTIEVIDQEAIDKFCEKLKKQGTIQAPPQILLGYRDGAQMDFDPYHKMGFTHPKFPEYYDPKKADPDFMAILEGIKTSMTIDEAVEVYVHNVDGVNNILVLNGATRTSCIGIIRGENSEAFRRINMTLFRGTVDQAKARMVRLNLTENRRGLRPHELLRAVQRFDGYGWTAEEICLALGKAPDKYLPMVAQMLNAVKTMTKPVWKALELEKISRQTAIDTALLPEDKQKALAEKAMNGEKVKAKDAKNEQGPKPVRIPVVFKHIETEMESLLRGLKDRRLGTKYQALYDNAITALEELKGAIAEDVEELK